MSYDWDAMVRLHEKGYIMDPVSKAKAVTFTEEGLRESERLLNALNSWALYWRIDPTFQPVKNANTTRIYVSVGSSVIEMLQLPTDTDGFIHQIERGVLV